MCLFFELMVVPISNISDAAGGYELKMPLG